MKKIYEPLRMNNICMKNRLVRSAIWEGIANQDGSRSHFVTDKKMGTLRDRQLNRDQQ